MVVRFIGRVPVIIGSVLFGIFGIVLIVIGATSTPTGTGRIILGAAFVVGALLLILDAVTSPRET